MRGALTPATCVASIVATATALVEAGAAPDMKGDSAPSSAFREVKALEVGTGAKAAAEPTRRERIASFILGFDEILPWHKL